jgi:putative membrane protein
MIADAMLSTAHFAAVFLLIGVLGAEFAALRAPLNADGIKRIASIDRLYGIAAVLVIVAGLSRVYFGLKDESFYWGQHAFWTKMGAFVLVGIISIWPTMRFIAWARASKAIDSFTPPPEEVKGVRRLLMFEGVLILVIVIDAALMARGLG